MRHGLQMRVCLGPDVCLWLTPNRPGAYLLRNSSMILIKSLTPNTFCYETNTAQNLDGNVVCTAFGEFSLYKPKAWQITQVSAVESAWGLRSEPGFVRAAFVLIRSLSLFGANKLVPSPANLSAWGFQSSNVICVPCWKWLLLPPSAGFQLCTISQMFPCAGIHVKFLPVI